MKHLITISLRSLAIAVALLLGLTAYAQIPVSGRVVDGNNEPIIGASVFVKGTQTGTATDADGQFSLKVPSANSVLVISYVGFNKVEIAANSATFNSGIVMKESSNNLDEVVVIGYGTVKKNDATGSVVAIKPDELNKGNRVTAQDALIGKIAGVNVVPGSGAPGSGATIRVRSGSSLSASNDPLIVIDGVPVDNSSINGSSNLIGSINPEDIETFTVLKDASATAIYGSRASNGVIVITTKKGTDKLTVNYTGNFSVSSTAKRLDVLTADEFRTFVPTVTGVPANAVYGTSNTDWQDEIYRTAFGTENNVSVGGKFATNFVTSPYRVSVGYTNQDGTIKTSNYKRLSFGGNLNPSFLDNHLTANLNLKASYEKNRVVSGSVANSALSYDPTRPVHTGSSTAATDPGLGYYIWTSSSGSPMAIQPDNPVAMIDLENDMNKVTRSIGNASFIYKIHGFEDLKLNLSLGYDVLKSKYNRNVPALAGMMYTGNQKDGTGLVYTSTQKKHNYLLDAYANYDHSFGKHTIGLMAGYGWQHFWKKFDATTLDPEGKQLSSPSHSESEYYLLSYYGRANYSYDNRYLVTATLRSDASSRFAKGNRWGLFPSAALAWHISQEDFLKDNSVLSDLKLRLGYGATGQQDILNDYPYMTTFSVSYPESMYEFGDVWYNTYRPNGYDRDIKWETTTTWNAGLDFGFLGNRINGSIDLYKRYTKNLLNTINVISGTNYSSIITTNIGKMENKGLEFTLNTVPVRTRDFQWDLGFNFTWNTSKITKLNTIDTGQNFVLTGYISETGKTVQVFMVGKRPYNFYLCKQAYGDDGKPLEGKYIQPDGSVSSTETKYADGRSALPKTYLGFNTRFTYKNWDLSASGHGSFGFYVYNYVRANDYVQSVYSDQGYFSNILRSTRDSGFQLQQLYSDYWLEKGNFFRFDNVTLGYNFKHLWDNSSTLRVTFGVTNLATITGYDGVDPEIYNGIDRNVYPRPRTFNLGLNLTF
ncbi:MAG: TonB-dependent receptor [Muribaculaceae bacterium]|jgi:TonB-linked SusC/RagA family outer membrane protein|nr:TonB-dependent receptor [Muribaculaceae bacterium]